MKIFYHQLILKIKIICVLMLSLLFCIQATNAQTKDSKGKDFWLMFNSNYNGSSTLKMFITAPVNTQGVVSVPGLSFSQSFTVTANTVTAVDLPNSLVTHSSDVIDNKGIHITAQDEVTVYGLNYIHFTTDAYLGLPTDALGTDYLVLSYTGTTEFGVVATANSTTVSVTPTISTGSHTAGVSYDIVLNQGQSYELSGSGDLTGSVITSNKPIGVFGANSCANIPPGYGYCDHICEMLPSTDTWGKLFGTVPLKSRVNGDTWRFLASKNNTVITINGVSESPINKGQYLEKIITDQSIIESNEPILVAQYSNGSDFSGNPGDPFMMLIPSLEQFLPNYTLTTVSGYATHYINLIVPNSVAGTLTLDGTPVPGSEYTAIGSTGYSGAQLQVDEGSHTLDANLPFGAFQYGFNTDDSYGYPGGQSFSPAAFVNSLMLTPETGSGEVNTSQCFTALVTNNDNTPAVGVNVVFNILGANAGTTGFETTGSDGKAKFCYDGPMAGKDTIIAIFGSLTDTSYFTRTKSNTNVHAPYFIYPPTPTKDTTINAHPGEMVMFTVQARDRDKGDDVTLTATGLPVGATTMPVLPTTDNPVSTKFSWTPGASDVGTYPVTFTATDNGGKTDVTTVIVQVTSVSCNNTSFRPFIFVYPLFTVANQAYHTIYKGYGQQSVVLAAVPRGGSVHNPLKYTFKWDDGSTLPLRRVSPDVTTTYNVDITDVNGCTAHASITIHVVDVRCGANNNKVQVCVGKNTLCVDSSSVYALIKGGAKLGSCGMMVTTRATSLRTAAAPNTVKAAQPTSFTAYPNPARSDIRFKWDMNISGNAKINIMDLQGRVIITQTVTSAGQSINISKLSNGVYMAQLAVDGRPLGTTRFTVSK